jgi:hypothetical protein
MNQPTPFAQHLADTIGEPYAFATPLTVDSDVRIWRDLSKVDCYAINPQDARRLTVTVSATLLGVLAEAVAARGEDAVLKELQETRDR